MSHRSAGRLTRTAITAAVGVAVAAASALAALTAASTEKTASYRISPALLDYLNDGLGMRLGSSTLLTGVRSGATVKVSLPAPAGLRPGLPLASRRRCPHLAQLCLGCLWTANGPL